MQASDLTASQACEVHNRTREMLAYLDKLQRRMEARGFDGNDRLYLEVKTARDAMQLLVSDLHRLACVSYGNISERE